MRVSALESRQGPCGDTMTTMKRWAVSMLRAAAMASVCAAMPLRAADDLSAARELTIRQCSQCHTFEKGDKHGQGPNLFGLLGREAGSAPGFVYSEGFKESLKGQIWDTALLERWLTDTLSVAPRAQMVYFQDDPKVRAKLMRYLQSLQ
jgi:cytochrome c